jgi:hypothetical protein
MYRGFIQTMPETAHDAQDSHLTGRLEDYLKQNFAFYTQLPSFLSVDRQRFGNDLSRQDFRSLFGRLGTGLSRCCSIGISKTTLPYRAVCGNAAASVTDGDPIPKSCTGNHTASATSTSGSVAIPGP